MTIYRGAGGSGDATNDATVTAVAAYAAQAATSATNSANSATTSESSATNSASSASNAAASASSAATSASQAASSQSAAATSATTAANSATSAGTQATVATNQANDAANSATLAYNSASTATTKAAEAATSASNAETSATNSANSAASALAIYGNTTTMNNAVTSATTSAANAAISASQAATSSGTASDFATQAGIYSGQAGSYASAAANSASDAATSANNAASIYGGISAVNAAVTQAQTSATASSAYSVTAQTAANTATTQATNAANSATQAANSAASAAAIVTGVASNRPSIRPSLLLDFANTKQLDPRITFSRPTTATYYDGKTVVKAEENLLTYSQDFDNAAWSKNAGVTAVAQNATVSPDGTTTAELITATTNASAPFVIQSSGISGTVTFSLYAKAQNVNFLQLQVYTTGANSTWFDLSTGAIGSTGAGVTAAIVSVGNGWYRCSMTLTTTAGSYLIAPKQTNGGNTVTTAGDGIYIWGAQLEQRSSVSAYTPTTTAPITNYIPALQTSAAGVPRFHHDPVTGESMGFLTEEQRTNIALQSAFASSWILLNSTYSNTAGVAPDGTQTASLIVDNSTNGVHGIYQGQTFSNSTVYTISCYAKANQLTSLNIYNNVSNTAFNAVFNLANGTVTSVANGGTATITSVGNGWYRCAVTNTVVTGSSANTQLLVNGGSYYSGNGYNGLFVWGVQVEAGSFATSYIPTVASQVTRSADSASMTGANFSSWFNQQQGVLYSEFIVASTSPSMVLVSTDNGASNGLSLYKSLGSQNLYAYQGSANAILGTVSSNVSAKAVTSFDSSGVAGSLNGAAVVSSSAGYPSSPTQLNIGRSLTSSNLMTGTIKRIAFWPKRLSNSELQGLTS